MNKLPRARTRFRLEPYPLTLYLYTNRATYLRALNLLDPKSGATPAEIRENAGMCSCLGTDILVGIFDRDVSFLVHELAHAVEYVADYVDLARGFDSSESTAYLMESMFRQCVGFIEA